MLTGNNLIDLIVNPFVWDKDFYKFDRFEKDMNPYCIKNDEKKGVLIISHNILGIDKKDITLKVVPDKSQKFLVISGKTVDKVTGKEYSIHSRFVISDDLDVKGITSSAENGLLYITIPYKKEQLEEEKTITINVE